MRWVTAVLLISVSNAFLTPQAPRFATWNRRVPRLRSTVWPEEAVAPNPVLSHLRDLVQDFGGLLGLKPTTDERVAQEEHAMWLQLQKSRRREAVATSGRIWDVESKLSRILRVSCGRLTAKEEAEVRRLFCELELLGSEQASAQNLEGVWKLLYASNKRTFPLPARMAQALRVGGVLPSLSAARDLFALRLPGLPPALRLQVCIEGCIAAVGANQVEVAFQRPWLRLGALRVPCGGKKTSRLTIVHSSSNFRLMRAHDGSMLIFALSNGCRNGAGNGANGQKAGASTSDGGGRTAAQEAAQRAAPAEAVVTRAGGVAWVWPL